MKHLKLNILPEYEKLICVYKLIFDGAKFYIGSTCNLKSRINIYNCIFNGKIVSRQSKSIIEASANCKSVEMQILFVGTSKQEVLLKEDFLLKENAETPGIINRNKNAFSNKHIEWTDLEKKKISDTMKAKYQSGVLKPIAYKFSNGQSSAKPVIMMDLLGNEIHKFPSIVKAADFIKSSTDSINNQIHQRNGRKRHHKGYTFKYA